MHVNYDQCSKQYLIEMLEKALRQIAKLEEQNNRILSRIDFGKCPMCDVSLECPCCTEE